MKVPSIRTKSVSTSIHPSGKIFQNLAAIWVGSPENQVYGNSVVLNHFAGVNKRRIHGRLQHGWPAHSLNGLYYKNEHLTTFVWCHATERAAQSKGWKSFHSIGAPWLYLLKILEADGWDVSGSRNVGAREKVLWVYGRHSLKISNSEDSRLLQFLEEANAQSSGGDMCLLYFEDFDSLESHVFSFFPNLEIVTLGQRSSSFLSDSHLVRLFHILQTTKEIKIDHPSTLVLYALTLNVKIGWIQNSAWDEALSLAKNLGMGDLVDLMCAAPDSSHHFRSFAYEHLGIDSVKSREELKRILGWGGGFKNFFRFLLLPIKTLLNFLSRLAR
jgi:hypothetical protein